MLVYQRVTNHVAVSEVIDPQVTMGLLKWFNDLDDFWGTAVLGHLYFMGT